MKTTKNLLIAAAMTGALAAFPLTSYAGSPSPAPSPSAEKQGCNGKASCAGKDKHKESCQGKDQQGKKKAKVNSGDTEKSACAGKDGCGGKDKQS